MVVPEWFRKKLEAINPRLRVKWNPRVERYILMMVKGDELHEYGNKFAMIDCGGFNKIVRSHYVIGKIETATKQFSPLNNEVLREIRARFCHYAPEVQEPSKLQIEEKEDAEFRASVRDWHRSASRKSLTMSGGDRL